MQLVAILALRHIVLIVLIIVDGGKAGLGAVVVDEVEVIHLIAEPPKGCSGKCFFSFGLGGAEVGIPCKMDGELAIIFRIIACLCSSAHQFCLIHANSGAF